MRASATITVKGTKYYKAAELFQRGSLSSGVTIRLEHQLDNPHDKNAVAVKIKRTGAMLGHMSKELAPKYAALIDEGKIIGASISRADLNGRYINIDVQVVYDQSDEQLLQKHNSRLWLSTSNMPTVAGVYSIRNIESGRQYVGSSVNLQDRIRSHLRDLSLGCHANHALQSDFSQVGADHFEAKVLASGITSSNLASVEADQIASFLKLGAALYNLTVDGQGTGYNYRGHTDSVSVSDRLAKQRAEAEQRRIDDGFLNRRKAVNDAYDQQLAALLPQAKFWAYFVATFAFALIALAIVIPKKKIELLFFLSGIAAFVTTPFIKRYFQEKAKQSAQYQSLVKKRDEQLEAISSECRKMRDI